MNHQHGPVFATGPEDPRLYDIDSDFRQTLIALSGLVAFAAKRRTRFLHPTSIGAGGTLTVVDAPTFPAHSFFRPGRVFPVLGRYSSSQGEDDQEISVRGLSLRLLDDRNHTASNSLDLTFNTGDCFFAPDAHAFMRLTAGTEQERDQFLGDHPRLRALLWQTERHATSFAAYELHSQAPRSFLAEDGRQWLARYRVLPQSEPLRPGLFDPGELWWPPTPPDAVPRPPGTTGSPTGLRDGVRDRLSVGDVQCVVQIQLHPVGDDAAEVEQALDATMLWPADYAWHDLAQLRFDRLLPQDETDAMAFDPAGGPAELAIALSRSPHSTASINHLRALIYRMSALARLGEPMPAPLAELLRPTPQETTGRTVCVIGAGPSGLAAARELERNGHRAIVVEAADQVAGKAASIDVDGHPHDLGAHICTARYQRLAALAAELDVQTEPTPAERVLTVGASGRTTTDMSFFTDGSVERYERLRAARFPRIAEPGLAHSAAELSAPLSAWLAEHDLHSMYTTFGLGYTCAGYGFPDDDLPALYFVKYAETTGLLSDSAPTANRAAARFTLKGGFGALWQKVADQLQDVRLTTTVRSIERHADRGVSVHTDNGTVIADDLMIAVPLDRIVDVLDATDEERRWAELIRYQRYRTTVASVSGLPRDAFYLLGEFADDSADRGHCVGFQHRYADSDVYTCYSYLGEDTAGQLTRDLAAHGGRDFRLRMSRDWTLMPHFTSADLKTGVLQDIEAAQGRRRTYLTGGLLGFESVECAMNHAQELVRREFSGAGNPAATEAGDVPIVRSAAEIRDWLIRGVAEQLEAPMSTVDPDGALSGFALDSLTLADLMSGLSSYVGFRVPHTVFLQLPTLNAIATHLAWREGAAPVRQWQAAVRRSFTPGAVPLFCVGGIGASGVYFRPLAAALGPDVPLYPFEVPGRLDGVGEPLDDVAEIAAGFVEQIRALVPDGPYHVGGHSYGGVIAYEIGRQLRAAGAVVAPVVLLDTFVAVAGQPMPADDHVGALRDQLLVRHMACVASGACDCGVNLDAPLSGQRTAVARALGAVDPDHYDEHIAAMIDVQLNSIRAYADYPFPPSDLTVHLVRTAEQFAPMPAADFGLLLHLDSPANGWERVEVGGLRVFPVSGNHFSMFMPPHVNQVTEAIHASLLVPCQSS